PAASSAEPPSAVSRKAPPVTPTPAEEPTPAERFEAAARTMEASRARATAPSASALGGLTSPMPPLPPVSDVRPGDKRKAAMAAAGTLGISESMTLSESAQRLAEELIRIPGIDRFGGTRLRDLDRSGPRSLRTLWGAARDELSTRYGDVTIGMLLDSYGQEHGQSGPPR
ncbi:MAG: hypothetical protein MUQ32_17140, partial [Chloroflexi bacterium]|nr:hypothetical protein [Chloroflexota bacterium]